MHGLPESFDMGKRLGLFIYFTSKVERNYTSDRLIDAFSKDYMVLRENISTYHSTFSSQIALNKSRVGLPLPSSRTSLDKILRMSYGLGLFNYEYNSPSKAVSPSDMTFLIQSFPEHLSLEFELFRPFKFILAKRILQKDWDLFVPLLRISLRNGLNLNSNLRGQLLSEYAKRCITQMEKALDQVDLSDIEFNLLSNRLDFYYKNLDRINSGISPSRGLIHTMEPRVHWIVDLLFCSFESLSKDGIIKINNNVIEKNLNLARPTESDIQSILSAYAADIRKMPVNDNYQELTLSNENTLQQVITDSIKVLSESLGKFIPVDILVDRVWSILMVFFNISQEEIFDKLSSMGLNIYRDWRTENGYVNVA